MSNRILSAVNSNGTFSYDSNGCFSTNNKNTSITSKNDISLNSGIFSINTDTLNLNKDISNTILFICVISIVYSYIGLIEQKNSKYPLMIYVLNTVSLLLTTYLISNNVSDIIFNHFMILLIAINYYRYRNEKKTTMYFVHIYISLIMFNYQIS